MKTKNEPRAAGEAAHTAGPWYQASTGNHQGLIISEATGANVAVAYDKKDGHLIAAAPSMLAALQSALALLKDPEAEAEDADRVTAELEAVIFKATA